MKNINRKTGILLGTGVVLSGIIFLGTMLRRKSRKTPELIEDDFDFYKMEEKSLDDFKEEEVKKDFHYSGEWEFLEDEYLQEELKSEEEKQEEFRELSVKVMDLLLREVISLGEIVKKMEEGVRKQNGFKEFMKELEQSKDEIISLWEHVEELSHMKDEKIQEKDRR